MVADVVAISPANIIWATKTEIFTKEILHVNVEIQIIAVCGLCDSKEWILASVDAAGLDVSAVTGCSVAGVASRAVLGSV